eukprot:TRINITY_DN65365_c0_g1_i2.p1 TRINITY_DN65365_c0_g1~~TRINITY_DN65365_c0_g1_i2.p1  ORF type:complete len:520 (+),score=52.07 TRINITY_DN65365_c0_g1_i2:84-1643(+)
MENDIWGAVMCSGEKFGYLLQLGIDESPGTTATYGGATVFVPPVSDDEADTLLESGAETLLSAFVRAHVIPTAVDQEGLLFDVHQTMQADISVMSLFTRSEASVWATNDTSTSQPPEIRSGITESTALANGYMHKISRPLVECFTNEHCPDDAFCSAETLTCEKLPMSAEISLDVVDPLKVETKIETDTRRRRIKASVVSALARLLDMPSAEIKVGSLKRISRSLVTMNLRIKAVSGGGRCPAERYVGDGTDYVGNQDKTWRGKTCQRWDSQTPHSHNHNAFPHNLCRNLDRATGIWCYTTDENERWDYCVPLYCKSLQPKQQSLLDQLQAGTIPPALQNVGVVAFRKYTVANYDVPPQCYEEEMLVGDGEEYAGKQTKTRSGKTCQRWDTTDEYDDLPENYCRNPDEADTIWCFLADDPGEWEYCDPIDCYHEEYVSQCDGEEEKLVGDGAEYTGRQTKTRSGRTCQWWDTETPHSHNFVHDGLPENYCRNPDGADTIWCYTTDEDEKWEYCDPVDCN